MKTFNMALGVIAFLFASSSSYAQSKYDNYRVDLVKNNKVIESITLGAEQGKNVEYNNFTTMTFVSQCRFDPSGKGQVESKNVDIGYSIVLHPETQFKSGKIWANYSVRFNELEGKQTVPESANESTCQVELVKTKQSSQSASLILSEEPSEIVLTDNIKFRVTIDRK